MPVTCRNVQHLYDAYLDGELSAPLLAEVEAHLLHCGECQRQVELVRAAGSVMATDASPVRLSDSFADRILAELPLSASRPGLTLSFLTRRQRRRRMLERFAAGFVPAVAAMIAFVVLIWPAEPRVVRRGAATRVLGETESGPAEAFGMRSLVDPTLAGVAQTGRVADQLRGFYRIAAAGPVGPPAPAVEQSPTSAAFSPTLMTDLLHPFLNLTRPAPDAAAPDEVVRF
ncbi:MAG: zf-HC2 domain-containing protein [Phycisphaerae bacterium]